MPETTLKDSDTLDFAARVLRGESNPSDATRRALADKVQAQADRMRMVESIADQIGDSLAPLLGKRAAP